MEKAKRENRIKEFAPAIWLSVAASFFVFLYEPVTLYVGNYLDLDYDIYDLLKYMPLIALGICIISILVFFILRKISDKVYTATLSLYFVALIASYIQGEYLVKDLPVMDGSEIDWSSFGGQRIITVIIWIILIVAVVLIWKFLKTDKLQKIIKTGSIVLFVFCLLSLVLTCTASKNAFKEKNITCMTADSAFEMSTDQNFIILLMDGVDAEVFTDVINENPEYKEVFEDFTYYPDTMAGYPYTSRAVPLIIFNKWYDNTVYYPYFLNDAVDESAFIERLESENYRKSIYFENFGRSNPDSARFENFRNVKRFKEPVKFCKMIVMLSGYRILPYDFKKYCELSTDDIYYDCLKTNEGEDIDYYEYQIEAFYNRVKNSQVALTDRKCFRFLYCSGAHYPYIYDADMNQIEEGSIGLNTEAAITVMNEYLKKLKDAGVYDNSIIFIMADHGMNKINPRSPDDKQNPMMLIKGLNEKHELCINNAPVSHGDLEEAYLKLLDGVSGDECFPYSEGDLRERRYMASTVLIEDTITEYMQTGFAADEETLVPTGNVYEFDWACVDEREALERAKG